MNIELDILRDPGLSECSNTEFLDSWKELAAETNHTSIYQEPAFVISWYKNYIEDYEPVLIAARTNDNKLVGLVPLAIEKNTNELMYAGAWCADYHGWLCAPNYEEQFIIKFLIEIKKITHHSKWQWNYLPPGCNSLLLDNKKLLKHGIGILCQEFNSPILDLEDKERINKIFKHRSIKNYLNRLKRRGELKIERVTSVARTQELMDKIEKLVNFRQAAIYNSATFEDDPPQKDFYISRSEHPFDSHFTILWMGDEILAFNFGCIENNTLHLGLISFLPTAAKYSPGVIFILYLSEFIEKEGIRYIDLTPGGDSYKERFRNHDSILVRPTFYFNKSTYMLALYKLALKEIIITIAKKCKFNIANIRKLKNLVSKKNKLEDFIFYEINEKDFTFENSHCNTNIRTQEYSDLLLYKKEKGFKERNKILSDAMQRFSRAEILFTYKQSDRLITYAWLTQPGSKYRNNDIQFSTQKNVVVIDCIQSNDTLPNHDLVQKIIPQILHYAFENGADQARLIVPNKHKTIDLIDTIKSIGFN